MRVSISNLSLRTKLVALILGITLTVNIVGLVVIYAWEVAKEEKSMQSNYLLLSRLVSEYLISPLEFGDSRGVDDLLQSLSSLTEVEQAIVYDVAGSPIASYSREKSNPEPAPELFSIVGGFFGGYLHVTSPIAYRGVSHGVLYLKVSLLALDELVSAELRIAVIVAIALVFFSIFLTMLLEGIISRPVLYLADVARSISEKGDYTVRVKVSGRDEISVLFQAFNSMLERIEERQNARDKAEKALVSYREHLEDVVVERTRELNDTLQELVKKEKLANLGQLIATVSHELRNPLGTIVSSVYMLSSKMREKNFGFESTINRIERSVDRCVAIIEDLLDYARTTSIKAREVGIDLWLNELLDDIVAPEGVMVQRSIQKGVQVNCDPEKMRRVVVNIVNNGFQALQDMASDALSTSSPGPCLGITLRTEEGRCFIEVTDNGPGIPADRLGKIFEPLYSTKSFGVGLGLAIVRQIMEQHSGGVEIRSKLGQGTIVALWLPMDNRESLDLSPNSTQAVSAYNRIISSPSG